MKFALVGLLIAGCTGSVVRDTSSEPFPTTPDEVARGKYLVDASRGAGELALLRWWARLLVARATILKLCATKDEIESAQK